VRLPSAFPGHPGAVHPSVFAIQKWFEKAWGKPIENKKVEEL